MGLDFEIEVSCIGDSQTYGNAIRKCNKKIFFVRWSVLFIRIFAAIKILNK